MPGDDCTNARAMVLVVRRSGLLTAMSLLCLACPAETETPLHLAGPSTAAALGAAPAEMVVEPAAAATPPLAIGASGEQDLETGHPVGAVARFAGVDFVWIPAGSFEMGSPPDEAGRDDDEGPVHRVDFSCGFWMGRCEVTNAQFCTFLNACGNRIEAGTSWLDLDDEGCRIVASDSGFAVEAGFDAHPVVEVSWWGARAFATWAGARLPSEAEWEYACRAGMQSRFATGDCISVHDANFNGEKPLAGCAPGPRRAEPVPAGTFAPNGWCVHDMMGNVWEWCEDTWHESYAGAPADGSAWTAGGDERLRAVRGGSWLSIMKTLRSAYRHYTHPEYTSGYTGFRIVRSAGTDPP